MSLLQISEPGESQVKEACAGRAIGIDLGTTNSIVATVRDGNPVALKDAKERALLPSIVHYDKDGGVLVGHDAQTLAADFAKDTIGSAKRFVGRGPKDAEATRKMTPYEFADASGPVIKFRVAGGREVTPVEVSAEILRVLRERAEIELGGPIDGAVITVPAYFDDAQRQATKDAGKLAGLNVLRLLNEPTAAALAYGLDKGSQGIFVVYDLGGGTFDVSILSLADGVFEVKATAGDSALGGDDFDRAIAGVLFDEMGLPDGGGDHTLVRRALDASRAAKERLTADQATDVSLAKPDGSIFRRHLTRVELDKLLMPHIERTAKPCRQAMKDAGITPGDIKGVVLVGGSTRTQAVRRHVAEVFGTEPLVDIDPDRVVAMGAAVQADILAGSGRRDDVLLLDVIPLSLGLEMMGGVVERIIHRNSTIPAGAVQTFTTFADKQTGFDIHVVQGERDTVNDCRSLARFKLSGLPPRPAGMARMDVTFLVDPDGILRVMAKDEETGKQSSIQVKPSYGLSDEEVERMLLDSYENAEADKNKRQLLTERVEADRIVAATKSAMQDAARLLDDEARTAIDAALAKLASVREGTDTDAIHAAVEQLDLAAKPFAQKRMEHAMSHGVRGHHLEELEQKL